jgi:hypothetical protein
MLLIISILVNVLVAGWASTVIFLNNRYARIWGVDSPGRRILACIYGSIALVSLVALVRWEYALSIAFVLFPLQILYKFGTLIAVSDKRNPVVLSNVAIALLHVATLVVLLR